MSKAEQNYYSLNVVQLFFVKDYVNDLNVIH